MTIKTGILPLAALASTLALSACGGGDGGVASTPPPPPASYTKLADLTGNQTFQSGGIHWTSGPVVGGTTISNQGADSFGSGPTFAYAAASDTFTITAPGGAVGVFTAADFNAAQSTATTRVFLKVGPSGQQSLRLTTPTINGVALSYTQFSNFLNASGSTATSWISVGGMPTIASDMPKSGTATYSAQTGANILASPPTVSAPFTVYVATAASTATFSANFGTGAINTSVRLIGAPAGSSTTTDFGTFSGTGTIASGGPAFSGTFAGTTGAGFSGAFFGPQALEMGYAYNFAAGGVEVFGGTSGVKQ